MTVQTEIEQRYNAHLALGGVRLHGKVAVVSGAGSDGTLLGIGAATAILFAAQGATVVIFDVDRRRAENTKQIIDEYGAHALTVIGDVARASDCEALAKQAVASAGGVDILVNNTGIARYGDITTGKDSDWQETIDVNLKGPMLLTQALLPALRASRGAVINVASIAAQQGFGVIAYSASKGGVISMTRDMAYSLGREGIRVNCLAPGHLATPMGGGHDKALREMRRDATMLDIEGSAWDAAWAALFLASPEARWITAATLNVDAGSTSVPSFNAMRSLKE